MSSEQQNSLQATQGSQANQDLQANQEKKEPTHEDVKKLLDDLDKQWWSTPPHMGNCGNCMKYAMLRPQDAGMFCYDC